MRALLKRDLLLAFRSGGGFGLALAFFLILILLVPFGVGPDKATLSRIAPGILWVGALLSCLLSLDRQFALDAEDGTLEVLMTSPLPPAGIALAKSLAHWLTTGLPLTALAPLLGYLLGLPGPAYGWLLASLATGTIALSIIGTFGAALTVGVRRGGLLLSLLVLPLYIPTLIFGAQCVARAALGEPALSSWLLLAGMTLLALAIVPPASGAALRANMR